MTWDDAMAGTNQNRTDLDEKAANEGGSCFTIYAVKGCSETALNFSELLLGFSLTA